MRGAARSAASDGSARGQRPHGCYHAAMKPRLPRIHPSRLLTAPTLRPVARDEGRTTLAVDGLVCGLCAARTRAALAGVEGVRRVDVDLGRGVAVVEHDGETPRLDAMRGALDRVVVAMPLRRLLERVARVRRRGAREAA